MVGGQLPDTSKSLEISSTSGTYQIFLDSNLANFQFPADSILISDRRFEGSYTNVSVPAIYVDALEENKTLETCASVLSHLQDLGAKKSTTIICVGGGIVQDISTLVASLYMRGIDWIYFPTTKMSQLDSCIGGKSSINLIGKKNLVGNIYPPKAIHIDFSFDKTLPISALVSGYLEAIKISFAYSREGFQEHQRIARHYRNLSEISESEITSLVLAQKKYFVEKDEFDTGIRQLLNYGHTFGHAIESATSYKIPHGVAIGLGMLMANQHPEVFLGDDVSSLNECIRNLLDPISADFMRVLAKTSSSLFLESFKSDKKHTRDSYNIIIPGESGLKKYTFDRSLENDSLIMNLYDQVRLEFHHEI
jgi:3-dehydroquinate synthase